MDLGLYIAASGMVAEQTRQDQFTNDLANAMTPGYKTLSTSQRSFGSILLSNRATGAAIGSLSTNVGLGGTTVNMAPGAIQSTGQPLDFAISGPGFFAVRTAGGVRYTRDGQFTSSAQGQLVDAAGNPVLDGRGAPIAVPAKGTVPASALGVYELKGATKQGENLFTGAATAGAAGTVRSGALEASGVDAARTTAGMMGALSSFQSEQQAIQAIDQTLTAACTQVGSLNGGGG
jgi:flagellar basal-body rod protein FlgF